MIPIINQAWNDWNIITIANYTDEHNQDDTIYGIGMEYVNGTAIQNSWITKGLTK